MNNPITKADRRTYAFRFEEGPEVIEQFMDEMTWEWEPVKIWPVGRGMVTYVVVTTDRPITPHITPVFRFDADNDLLAIGYIDTDYEWLQDGHDVLRS